ncbi:hypothetical protein, partial [Novosphingobium sp. MBES04]|uniref:hypothetical protein n=1 Tax=Novosphingobium sp. MBES04 TaxID=1206458 RepID=UPI00131F1783
FKHPYMLHLVSMDYRQNITHAVIAEIRHQLDGIGVDHCGTTLQVDGSFKLIRVVEAIIKSSLIPEENLVKEVAISITPPGHSWHSYRDAAVDAIAALNGSILTLLDPLP